MSIEITAGAGEVRGENYRSRDTVAQATATTLVTLSPTTNYSRITGGTATGFGNNGYSLADGRDGQTKEIIMTSTGEATIHFTGTSTGAFVLTAEDDSLCLGFLNSKWRVFASSGATKATAT